MIFLSIIWWLWRARNAEILGGEAWSMYKILRRINATIIDFQTFHHTAPVSTSLAYMVRWDSPPSGIWKLNVDGSALHCNIPTFLNKE